MKRTLDIFIVLLSIPIIAPLFIFFAFLIKINLGSPVFFIQRRPGINGNLFNLYKFRSMTIRADLNSNNLEDSMRLTRFGKFLRSSSIDELPELWNVLNGTMSIVGPRPLLEEYLPLYSAEQFKRHEVKPGITGWAQVNGRNALSWEEKFNYDIWYVENQSFFLDIKILFLTIIKVINRDGISADGEATMYKFTGTKK
ncbi:sugar transferase [Pseudothioglobus sp. nBUS_23]|uniref:sugar transferase n=1 Tax=Pseudothioglobus sp. nBUS_23 TaxID=3395318 RepID=UPI003EB8FCB2